LTEDKLNFGPSPDFSVQLKVSLSESLSERLSQKLKCPSHLCLEMWYYSGDPIQCEYACVKPMIIAEFV